jgi:D-alanyl-D-alanine carboxypeptidase
MYLARIVLALVWSGILSTGFGQQLDLSTRHRVDRAVKSEMTSQNLVGVSIGIIRQGKIVYVKGYGLAVREDETPFTSKTITNWASNSKPVVAVLAMQLMEAGKLRLADKVIRYLPELPSHCNGITVRHLLCHQSGYPHYSNGTILKLAKPITSQRGARDPAFSINRFGGSPLLRAPGTGYSYSSYAFVILSAVIQRAGNQNLPDQIKERITQKLRLDSFGLDEEAVGQKNWSVGYKKNALGDVERVPSYAHDWKHGAGAYKSNIEDFANWAAALINSKLVNQQSQQRMWTAQNLDSGKPTNAGLGFFVSRQNNTLKVYHGGSHSEARSRMVLYPDRKQGIVVLANCGHAELSKISTAIYRAFE